jgi:hypothetical protein
VLGARNDESSNTTRRSTENGASRPRQVARTHNLWSSNVAYIGTLEVDSHLVLTDTTKCLELEVMRPQKHDSSRTHPPRTAPRTPPGGPYGQSFAFQSLLTSRRCPGNGQSPRSDLYHEVLGARSDACQTRLDAYTSTPNCASHPRQASRTANPFSSKAFLYPRGALKVASPLALTGTTKLFELEAMRPQTRLNAYTSIANCASRSRQAAPYCVLQDSTSSRPHNKRWHRWRRSIGTAAGRL